MFGRARYYRRRYPLRGRGKAGRYAGHHGVLGAAAGCLYGRHRAKEQARQQQDQGQPPAGQDKL